jgi:hypothetical protein
LNPIGLVKVRLAITFRICFAGKARPALAGSS